MNIISKVLTMLAVGISAHAQAAIPATMIKPDQTTLQKLLTPNQPKAKTLAKSEREAVEVAFVSSVQGC